jgi:hypothetical protein
VTAHRAPERTLEMLEGYSREGSLEFKQELGAEVMQADLVTASSASGH